MSLISHHPILLNTLIDTHFSILDSATSGPNGLKYESEEDYKSDIGPSRDHERPKTKMTHEEL